MVLSRPTVQTNRKECNNRCLDEPSGKVHINDVCETIYRQPFRYFMLEELLICRSDIRDAFRTSISYQFIVSVPEEPRQTDDLLKSGKL